MNTTNEALLAARGLRKAFGRTEALRGASLAVAAGETVAVTGRSGSGKSTLLLCLAGVLRPEAGEVTYGGRSLDALSEAERTRPGTAAASTCRCRTFRSPRRSRRPPPTGRRCAAPPCVRTPCAARGPRAAPRSSCSCLVPLRGDAGARIAIDHTIYHLDADLKWLETAAARVAAKGDTA